MLYQHYNSGSKKLKSILQKIVTLLFAAGEFKINITEKDDSPVVLSLKETCRREIRKHLIDINPQSHMFGRVPRLGLPTLLQSYLLYDQTLELEEETEMDKEYNELTEQMKLMRLEDKTIKENLISRITRNFIRYLWPGLPTPRTEENIRLEDKTMKENEDEGNLTSAGCAEGGADVEMDDDKPTRQRIQRIHIRKFKFTYKREGSRKHRRF